MNKSLSLLILLSSLGVMLLINSCKKENNVTPEEDTKIEKARLDTSEIDIPKDNGSIGLVIDTRPLFKKKYHIRSVKVEIKGSLSKFSQTLDVDSLTNLVVLKISRDSLTQAQIEQFARGVDVTISTYMSGDSPVSRSDETGVMFDDSGVPYPIETDLKVKFLSPVTLDQDVPYYVQMVPDDNKGLEFLTDPRPAPMRSVSYPHLEAFNADLKDLQTFYFEPVPDVNPENTPYIKEYFIRPDKNSYIKFEDHKMVVYEGTLPTSHDAFRFKIIRYENGKSAIVSYVGAFIKSNNEVVTFFPSGYSVPVLSDNLDGTSIRFKFIPADIEWSVKDLGVVMSDPILPPKKIDFALPVVDNFWILNKHQTFSLCNIFSAATMFSIPLINASGLKEIVLIPCSIKNLANSGISLGA